MKKIKLITLAIVAFIFLSVSFISIEARPRYMRLYNGDAKAKTQYKNKCTMCHIGKGGGENTNFGEDFADEGHKFTPALKAKYPQFFKK